MLPKNFQRSPFRLYAPSHIAIGYAHRLISSYALKPRPTTPDLPVERRDMPVVGFRAWEYDSTKRPGHEPQIELRSISAAGVWPVGDAVAECRSWTQFIVDPNHAPAVECECGLYVLRDLDQVESHVHMNPSIIVGLVMGWGRVIQHGDEGWRAQHARILALLDGGYGKKQLKRTRRAAAAYGVEVKTRPQLEAMAREFGDPLPTQEAGPE